MQKNTLTRFAIAFSTLIITFVLASAASADTINLAWDQNPEPTVIGYKVHVGTQAGTYTQHIDVGPTTAWTFANAVAGQQYCFTVTAYVAGPLEGPPSNAVCGFSNAPPVLTNPGARTSSLGQPTSLQLVGSDPMGQVLTYSATGLPPGLTVMASTGYISGTPTTAGNYSVTASASDGVLTASQTFTWSITTVDTVAPVVTITGPTSAATYSTTAMSLTLSGTASDNVGVTQVTWVSNRGGSGTASGTTSWTTPIALQTGDNVLTITARDAAGNTSSDALTVTVSGSSSDTTPPVVTITWPTSAATYSTAEKGLSLRGTASDNVGVTQVTWVNNRGGSGTASGTTSWTTTSIALQAGDNVLTVTARDAAGNTSTDVVTVTAPGGSSDTTAPVVTITGPTSAATHSTTATSLTLSGTASDNVGVTQVTWANNRGGSGTASGTTSWTTSVALQTGDNVLTVTARDAAGNTSSDALTVTVTTADTTAPVVTITSPTTAATFKTTTATLTLGGTASDNVGVTQVTWANNRGGSGTASGTTNWSGSVTLLTGSNVLTVTARDAAGNTKTATITVTLNTPPTLSGVASRTSPMGTPDSMQLSAADPDGDVLTYGASGMPPGLAIAVSTGLIAGTPSNAGVYPVTVTVTDGMQSATSNFTWTVTAPADTVAPVVTITTPTTSPTFTATAGTLSLGGTASDNVGVTQVTWTNNRGGSGTASGTTNWTASVALQGGSNVLTVTARDLAGNTSTDTLTVSYAAPSITLTITSDKPSPQVSGTSVMFAMKASGGATPYTYLWRVFNGVSWSVAQPGQYEAGRMFSWKAPAVGSYVIEGSAKDANGVITTTTVPFQVK